MKKTKVANKSNLAKNIVLKRKRMGFNSAEDFAEDAEIPYPTLRDIEAGISGGRPETLHKIAAAFGCKIEDLYEDPSLVENEKPIEADHLELFALIRRLPAEIAKDYILGIRAKLAQIESATAKTKKS